MELMAGPKIYQIWLGRFIARMSHQGKKRLDLWLCIIQGDRSLEKNLFMNGKRSTMQYVKQYVKSKVCQMY